MSLMREIRCDAISANELKQGTERLQSLIEASLEEKVAARKARAKAAAEGNGTESLPLNQEGQVEQS